MAIKAIEGHRLRGKLADQSGSISLAELLTGAVLTLIVMVAALFMWLNAAKAQVRNSARARTQTTARQAMERMTREIRQATSFAVTDGSGAPISYVNPVSSLQFTIPKPKSDGTVVNETITYLCVAISGGCLRLDSNGSSWILGAEVDRRTWLSRADIFTVSEPTKLVNGQPVANDKPRRVELKIELAVRNRLGAQGKDPAHPIVLSDGVDVRGTAPQQQADAGDDDCDFAPEPPGCDQ